MYTYNQENQEPVGLTDPGLRKITWIVSSDVEWLEPCNLGGQADPGGGARDRGRFWKNPTF